MKTLLSLSVAIFISFSAFEKPVLSPSTSLWINVVEVAESQQTCDCKKDLAYINEQVQEMVSFKKQIKGEQLKNYLRLYDDLYSSVTEETPIAECYLKLNTLISMVRDKHARILHIKNPITNEMLESDSAMETFRTSEAFLNHPKTDQDITKLSSKLAEKEYESIEGIYAYQDMLKIGIVKNGEIYQGVVLESTSKNWLPGQIKYTLKPVAENMYDVMTSDYPGGKMRILRALLHYDGRIWHLKKDNDEEYTHVGEDQNDWEFKQIDDYTQYVYFGSFSNADENVQAFEKFYETYKEAFTAKNIIVDLRDNAGGNSKYSDPFYKIIKKNKMNVFVVTNFFTGSNGEQFTLKLKGLKNAKHLGQRTYGALAYGSNYGKLLETPSGEFAIYPTDMNFHKFIDYEYVGVQPEMQLDFDKDWIEQTLDIIAQQ
ncbi:hypothetical protein EAX61_11335 [Dokdonia sinensis]|uniref:Tail specific protease domain-containing protein n=1 Tax=Dokdonia sinensis TaxID=2479847 RepID=A0A3M0G6A2_9FLAO|nr:S41 family peptidase [Dokdonia sinensis]RMB57333.1 hypothetical protein EAX61_11335 [Dokdonia sinensis]